MSVHRLSAACILTLLFAGMIPTVSAAPVPFPDTADRWYRYREAIQYLKDKDVIGGYPDGGFHPKDTINRAELLKIVFKGKSDVTPVTRRCFSDVNPTEWYAPYICAAKNRGIVDGYDDGNFRPGQAVNAAEAIKIVLQAYGRTITEPEGEKWYLPYVQELADNHILPASSYLPWEPLTRERAADLLWRMLRFEEDRVNPQLSPGCGKAAVPAPLSIPVDGRDRTFLLTIPSGYVQHDPAPLIIAFHGRTNSNEQVRQYYRLDREAAGAIIAYPAAVKKDNGSFTWSDTGDTRYFDALVEHLAGYYCIDMERIFVVGHSLGAWMANTVACYRGGVVRGSATVGGDSVITDCDGPAAALIAHNPRDTLAPFSGAEKVRAMRIKENGCAWETVASGPDVLNCVRHLHCPGGNDILWCPHAKDTDERGVYYPHNWPRETGNIIWEFFRGLK